MFCGNGSHARFISSLLNLVICGIFICTQVQAKISPLNPDDVIAKKIALHMTLSKDAEDFVNRVMIDNGRKTELLNYLKFHNALKTPPPKIKLIKSTIVFEGNPKIELTVKKQIEIKVNGKALQIKSRSVSMLHQEIEAFIGKQKSVRLSSPLIPDLYAIAILVPLVWIGGAVFFAAFWYGVYRGGRYVWECASSDKICLESIKPNEVTQFVQVADISALSCHQQSRQAISSNRTVNNAEQNNLVHYAYHFSSDSNLQRMEKKLNGKLVCSYTIGDSMEVREWSGDKAWCPQEAGNHIDIETNFPHEGLIECCKSPTCEKQLRQAIQDAKQFDDRKLPNAPQFLEQESVVF